MHLIIYLNFISALFRTCLSFRSFRSKTVRMEQLLHYQSAKIKDEKYVYERSTKNTANKNYIKYKTFNQKRGICTLKGSVKNMSKELSTSARWELEHDNNIGVEKENKEEVLEYLD